jgi:hypothetical protein
VRERRCGIGAPCERSVVGEPQLTRQRIGNADKNCAADRSKWKRGGWLRGDAPLAARARGGWWSSARDGLPGGAHCTALNSRAPGLRIVDTCVARISNAWNFSLPTRTQKACPETRAESLGEW